MGSRRLADAPRWMPWAPLHHRLNHVEQRLPAESVVDGGPISRAPSAVKNSADDSMTKSRLLLSDADSLSQTQFLFNSVAVANLLADPLASRGDVSLSQCQKNLDNRES